MRWNKKASLEIGVNTIVILVIAMVLLGLGVGFIKGLFAKAGTTIDIIDPSGLQTPPTPGDPIRISPTALTMKQGSSTDLVVGVYNAKTTTQTVTLALAACQKNGAAASEKPLFSALTAKIESGQSKGFKTLLEAKKDGTADLSTGVYLCSISAKGPTAADLDLQGEFTLTVTT